MAAKRVENYIRHQLKCRLLLTYSNLTFLCGICAGHRYEFAEVPRMHRDVQQKI